MNTKLLAATLLLSMMAGGASAQTVSQEDAAAKAVAFMKRGPMKVKGQATSPNQLEMTHKAEKDGETYYYIFNDKKAGSFVIVAGDERATEILGYGEHGCLDFEQAPDNFKWWMSQYEAQIHAAIDQDLKPAAERKAMTRAGSGRVTIEPLIETQWNQSVPYNDKLPYTGSGDYALATGCVATAMAQVMYYHKWPETTGYGSHSYNGIGNTLFEADFARTTYDWGNMLDEYRNGNYTQAQADAVATLMYHCGVAVEMNYGQIVTGGSGAAAADIPKALTTYFGYDKSALYVQRDYYTDEEWTDMIYNELRNNRPVLYGGQNAYGNSGHEFVCHGYNAADNTFAINWGWGGYQDGYFTLLGVDGLQPGGSGIGGSGEGASYTRSQDIVINVMPDQGTSKTPLSMFCNINEGRTVQMITTSEHPTPVESPVFDLTQDAKSYGLSFHPWNLSGDTREFETSVMFRDVMTGATFYAKAKSSACKLDNTYLTQQTIVFGSDEFEINGTYEVLPVVREKGETEWQRLRFPTSVQTPTITVIGGRSAEKKDITFAISGNTVEERGTLTITHDKMYTGAIAYTASPAGIVSIDENGVVTGVKAGTTTITVTGAEDTYYLQTTKNFEVTVTPYVKVPVTFTLDETALSIGEYAQISYEAPDYTGTMSFTSSNESVATVDAQGKITAISDGQATITAHAEEDDLYVETSKSFDVIVSSSTFPLVDVKIKNNGYITPNDAELTFSVKNKSTNNYSQYPFGIKAEVGRFTFHLSQYLTNFYVGDVKDMSYDLDGCSVTFGSSGTFTGTQMLTENIGKDITITISNATDWTPLKPSTLSQVTMHVVDEISVYFTMTDAGWGTLCLPFEAEVPGGLTAYKITGADGAVLIKEEVDYLEMNTPYLVSGEAGVYSFTGPATPIGTAIQVGLLVGNTDGASAVRYAPKDSYVLQKNKNTGKVGYYRVAEDNAQRLRAYSAYLKLPGGGNGTYYSISEATDIEEIGYQPIDDDNCYQLDGTRIDGNTKGLMVKNGKLIFVK